MNLLTDEALTEKQLYRLKDHKYSSSGKSILESKLQPFWNKVVEKVPLWSRFFCNPICLEGLHLRWFNILGIDATYKIKLVIAIET